MTKRRYNCPACRIVYVGHHCPGQHAGYQSTVYEYSTDLISILTNKIEKQRETRWVHSQERCKCSLVHRSASSCENEKYRITYLEPYQITNGIRHNVAPDIPIHHTATTPVRMVVALWSYLNEMQSYWDSLDHMNEVYFDEPIKPGRVARSKPQKDRERYFRKRAHKKQLYMLHLMDESTGTNRMFNQSKKCEKNKDLTRWNPLDD